MILNRNLILSEGQAITVTAISENVIRWLDNGIVPLEGAPIARNLGQGTPIPFLIQVTEAFQGLTSLTIETISADDETLTTNATVLSSSIMTAAQLVPGARPPVPTIMPDSVLSTYFGMRYTVTGGPATAGAITVALATAIQEA